MEGLMKAILPILLLVTTAAAAQPTASPASNSKADKPYLDGRVAACSINDPNPPEVCKTYVYDRATVCLRQFDGSLSKDCQKVEEPKPEPKQVG
jgi:hypothetical protein